MKKTIVLLTIVLAIVAAPVFAEVTASGDLDLRMGFNGDNYAEKNDNDLKVTYGATLSDFTSIDVTAEASNETTKNKEFLKLNEMTVTQDITGALGIDSGIGLAMTFGIASFEPKEYQNVAGYGDFEYSDGDKGDNIWNGYYSIQEGIDVKRYMNKLDPGTIMTKASISAMDMITIDAVLYEPSAKGGVVGETFSDSLQFGINAYGTFGVVDASFNFNKMAKKTNSIGFNAAAAPMDGLKVGAGMEMFLDDGESLTDYGVSVAYTISAFTAGLAMTSHTDSIVEDDFDVATGLAVNLNYQVTEAAKAFAGIKMTTLSSDVDMEDKLAYEVGASYVLDSVTYSLGYTKDSDYIAYNGIAKDGNVFFRVQAEF